MVSTWYCGRLLAFLLLFCVASRAVNLKSQMRKSSFRQTNEKLWGLDSETNSTSVGDENTEDENSEDDSEDMPSEIYHQYMEECSASQKPTKAEEEAIIVQANETDNATVPVDLKEVAKQKKLAMEQLKSQACKPEEETPFRSMSKAFYQSLGDKDITGQTISINLMNKNRPVTLQGWNRVRKFSKGFVKTTDGAAFATVNKLKPGQEYSYGIYQYDSTSATSKSIQQTIRVNNGPAVVTEPNIGDKPTAFGKAKADAQGAITFKFERKPSPECVVKGILQCGAGVMGAKPELHTFNDVQYCCPPSGTRFVTLEYPAVTCPDGTVPVTTADLCKKLANGAGREYRGILNNDANYITGCFEWTAHKGDKQGFSQYVYFNTRVTSSLVAKIGGHRLCQVASYKARTSTDRFCEDEPIKNIRSTGLEDCRNKCDSESKCRFISFWRGGPALTVFPSTVHSTANWCRLTASCSRVSSRANSITIEEKLHTQHELVLSGISIATSCDPKKMSFREVSAQDFNYDPVLADLADLGSKPDKASVVRFQNRMRARNLEPVENTKGADEGVEKTQTAQDKEADELLGNGAPNVEAEEEKELEGQKAEMINPMNSTEMEFFADRVKTPDLSRRSYELPSVANNSVVNTLLTTLIEGGDAELNVPDLKQLDSATSQDIAHTMLQTIHHVDVQTNLVYKHWLSKTCKEVKEADDLQSKEKKKLKDIKALSKVCRESIEALRKQKVTEQHPKPKPLGEGKAGFEVANPDERSREYSYSSHASSMLDSGNEFTKKTINSNRRGESVVIKLGKARMVRGIVTQGHKLTTSYMYTYNVQYQDESGKWHTITDDSIKDTPNWNSGQYSKRCVDTNNWRSRRYGWYNGRHTALPCDWFASRRYCIRRNPPSRGYLRYSWLGRANWNYPNRHCCACGKAPEKRTCSDYVSNGWCSNGHVTFKRNSNLLAYFDSKHRYPMQHCTACGKGAVAFTGGQYDNKVTAFLEKPVLAKAIRIITKTGYPVFRVGVIVGKSEVEVALAGTPWVGSVNFDFPHHPYKILTSNDGRNWKLAASGINQPTFYFNPPLHTSHIKLDYEQESCLLYGGKPLTEDQIKALGFKLVRRNGANQGARLHQARDQLTGTQAYGTACTGSGAATCNRDFSTRWSDEAYDEFLITTGNLKHWVQVKKSQVLGWYSNSARTVLCSSDSKTEHTVRWYRRIGVFEDPWISVNDYLSDEKEAQVAPSGRSAECGRGGVHANVYDDNDGQAVGAGSRRYLTRGDKYNSHTESTIDSDRGWSSCEKTRGHWLQLDLGATKKVKGVITQPRADRREWVTGFKVRYTASSDTTIGWKWATPKKGSIFEAPGWDGEDANVKTKNYFANIIEARYIRIYPVRWNAGGYPGLRADVLLDSGVDPVFLYGGDSYAGLDKTRTSRENQGLNVYIRMAYKRAKLPTLIPVRFEGYTADPGNLMFPDSKPRLDSCGDATKKKKAKEIALEEYQQITADLAKHRKNIAENVDFINNIKGVRARTESFRLDYIKAFEDAVEWSHVLMNANISLTTVSSAENKSGKPDLFDGDSQDEAEGEPSRNVGMSKEDREELEREKAQEGVNPNSNDDDDDADEEESTTPPQTGDIPRFLRKRSHRAHMLDPDLMEQEMF